MLGFSIRKSSLIQIITRKVLFVNINKGKSKEFINIAYPHGNKLAKKRYKK